MSFMDILISSAEQLWHHNAWLGQLHFLHSVAQKRLPGADSLSITNWMITFMKLNNISHNVTFLPYLMYYMYFYKFMRYNRNGGYRVFVDFRAYSRAYPHLSALTPAYSRLLPLTPAYSHLLPLTPAHADAQISTGEWQKSNIVLALR